METEKFKFSHFDRTRGDKNQIFRTPVNNTIVTQCQLQPAVEDHLEVLVQGTTSNDTTDTTVNY